jgi:hypothetical protein
MGELLSFREMQDIRDRLLRQVRKLERRMSDQEAEALLIDLRRDLKRTEDYLVMDAYQLRTSDDVVRPEGM